MRWRWLLYLCFSRSHKHTRTHTLSLSLPLSLQLSLPSPLSPSSFSHPNSIHHSPHLNFSIFPRPSSLINPSLSPSNPKYDFRKAIKHFFLKRLLLLRVSKERMQRDWYHRLQPFLENLVQLERHDLSLLCG